MDEIFYKKLGKGRPVVLIHGFCENHEIWSGFADRLAESFEVFIIDLPGFGQSSPLSIPFSIEDISKKVLNWMDQINLDAPVVIGHSLGGYVALAMASCESKNIAGLGLFHSTPYPDSAERKSNRNRVIEFVNNNGVAPFVDTFVPGLFFDKKHPAIPSVDKIARKTSKETLIAYTTAMRDRASTSDILNNFNKPVLILGGEHDSIITTESIRGFGHSLKKGTVRILNETCHMGMFEQPEAAISIISEFLLVPN